MAERVKVRLAGVASLLESWMREAAPGVTAWLSAVRETAVLAWERATVPVAFGTVIVRAAVGLVAVMVVSKPSAEDPSKTRALLTPQMELAALTLLVDSVETKTVADVAGNVNVVLSVPASVRLLDTARVLPSVSVSVAPVAGAVSVILFTVVAVATPRVGVVRTGAVSVLLVRVAVLVAVMTVPLVLGNVIVVPSVPAKVSVLLAVRVLPFATVNVPVLVVIVRPLTLVAVATPRVGVVITGAVRTGAVSVLLVRVAVDVRPTSVWLVLGNVIVVPSVPAKVSVLFAVTVLPFAMVNVPVVVVIVRPYRILAAVTFLSTPASLMGNSSVPTKGDFADRPVTVAASRLKANKRLVRMRNEVFMGVGSGFEGVGFLQEIEAIGWDFNEAECDSSSGTCTSGDGHRSCNIWCLRPTVKVQGKHCTTVGRIGEYGCDCH